MNNTFFALRIQDEYGWEVVSHVANYADDTIHTDHEDLPQNEWRKAHHLVDWVKKNKPNWRIQIEDVPYKDLFVS